MGMEFCVSLILSRYWHTGTFYQFRISQHRHQQQQQQQLHFMATTWYTYFVRFSFLFCFFLAPHHSTSLHIIFSCFGVLFAVLIVTSESSDPKHPNDSFDELKIYQHNLGVRNLIKQWLKNRNTNLKKKNHGTWSFFDTICTRQRNECVFWSIHWMCATRFYTPRKRKRITTFIFGGTVIASVPATTEAASIAAHRKWMTMLYAHSIFLFSFACCMYAERKPVARTTKRNAAAILTLVPNQQQSQDFKGITKSYVRTRNIHTQTPNVCVCRILFCEYESWLVWVCLGYYYVQQLRQECGCRSVRVCMYEWLTRVGFYVIIYALFGTLLFVYRCAVCDCVFSRLFHTTNVLVLV